MKNILILLILVALTSGCDRMQEKSSNENKGSGDTKNKTEGNQSLPEGHPNVPGMGTDSKSETQSSGKQDEKAEELVKLADATLEKYNSDKSEGNKKEVVSNLMAAANYLMFEAGLPAKEKYRPALKYYRKVLEVDPKNAEALTNKKQIEDIYESMGMPIPQ